MDPFTEIKLAKRMAKLFNKSVSKLAVLLTLRRSFQWRRRIFRTCNWPMSKVEKTVEGTIDNDAIDQSKEFDTFTR